MLAYVLYVPERGNKNPSSRINDPGAWKSNWVFVCWLTEVAITIKVSVLQHVCVKFSVCFAAQKTSLKHGSRFQKHFVFRRNETNKEIKFSAVRRAYVLSKS
jgi:hypothetical protein